ncbi:MAG: site-2 protease family protein [Candidatus Geothermarchaeales archaeon]
MRTYSSREVKELLIAWIVLGLCFSVRALDFPPLFPTYFAAALLTVGVAFIFHELAHKYIAQRYGCWAEFRLWSWGLLLALLMAFVSRGRILFAAPGAVYIVPLVRRLGWDFDFGLRGNGLISLSGPLINVFLAVFFSIFRGLGGFIGLIGSMGYMINLWLAMFNMLPFPPLDGSKVFAWNKVVWAVITLPLIALVFFPAY